MKKNKNFKDSWRTLDSKEIYSTPYFHLKVESCELPDGRVMPKYFVMDFPDWVQIVARDQDRNFVMVRQYRYPADSTFLEFPGGSTHSGSTEDPELAARRELLEETGHESKKWSYLGFYHPNPALMGNKCHVYFADECFKTSDLNLDPFELLEVEKLSLHDLEKAMKATQNHALVLATYQLARTVIES